MYVCLYVCMHVCMYAYMSGGEQKVRLRDSGCLKRTRREISRILFLGLRSMEVCSR